MKLNVKNLGAINSGEIDCNKGLTILTGPNNTGKSYLTYLIYGVSKFDELHNAHQLESELIQLFSKSKFLRDKVSKDKCVHLEELATHHLTDIGNIINRTIQGNLVTIFASKTIKSEVLLEMSSVNLNYEDDEYQQLRVVNGDVIPVRKNGISDKHFSEYLFDHFTKSTPIYKKAAAAAALILSYDLTSRPLFGRAFFFPAERTAINLFAKHLVAKKATLKDKLDNKLLAGVETSDLAKILSREAKLAPKYPYAINSYINFVNEFDTNVEEGEYADLANKLERIIAGGTIKLSKFNQVLFTPDNSSEALDLHLASSLVKSLSYTSLYLRYVAKRNDLVIIDEPELNLHPNLQIAIARIISEMVNSGLNVILSTHSDYLIKEINNLTLLHKLPKSKDNEAFIETNGYKSEQILDSKNVGAYFLSEHTIIPIDIEENGIEVPSINDAIIAIDSMAEEIFFRLEEE